MNLRGVLSTLILSALAVALTLAMPLLAPLPLMLLRRNGGRMSFLTGSVIAVSLLIWLATPSVVSLFLAAVILALVFCECENQNIGYSSSAFVVLLVLAGFGAIATGYAIQHFGFDPIAYFRNEITQAMAQVALPSGFSLDKEALVKQIPSALIILVIFSVWINSVLVSRMEHLLGWTPTFQSHIFVSSEFREWKLPDSFVWIALAAAGGSYFEFDPLWLHWVAANVFNIAVMLYFFQGLAVIVDFFAVKRTSVVWRTFAYLLIFLQLFLMVAFLGFVDLWLEFRNRKKSDKSAVA